MQNSNTLTSMKTWMALAYNNLPADQFRSKEEVQLPLPPLVGVLPQLFQVVPQLFLLLFQALEVSVVLLVFAAALLSHGTPIVWSKLSETWKIEIERIWLSSVHTKSSLSLDTQLFIIIRTLSHQSLLNSTRLRCFFYVLFHCCKKWRRWLFSVKKKIVRDYSEWYQLNNFEDEAGHMKPVSVLETEKF